MRKAMKQTVIRSFSSHITLSTACEDQHAAVDAYMTCISLLQHAVLLTDLL